MDTCACCRAGLTCSGKGLPMATSRGIAQMRKKPRMVISCQGRMHWSE